MKYEHMVQGEFLARPNRFIAQVKIEGQVETVHVKNTGRCRELLDRGVCVYLEESDKAGRKTKYDLVAVKKGRRLINMDSQAPNKAVGEWLMKKTLFPGLVSVRPECRYGNSRFDFYIEDGQDRIFMEVKGVTLEKDGVAGFPDAPSERAVKHVEELIAAYREGYRALLLFVIQMEGVKFFTPNLATHPQFGEALIKAREAGVEILAWDCRVTPDEMEIRNPVPVHLDEGVYNFHDK